MPYLRLRQICLATTDLDAAVDELQAIFGLAVCHRDPNLARYGLVNAVLPVGHQFIEVIAPTREGTAAGRFLARGGRGAYMLILDCGDVRQRLQRLTQDGIRIVNLIEYDDYTGVQLHPRDTGATMLEFNQTRGGASLSGAYHPAGHDWQQVAQHASTVQAMAAVHVEVAAGDLLPAKWAALMQRPLAHEGTDLIRLDDGEVRFVPARDDVPAALSGVVLETRDAERVRAAAAARGCLTPASGGITLCGVEFTLAPVRTPA